MDASRLAGFVEHARGLKGDGKGEAQPFLDRLYQAFGHAGVHGAGAALEHRLTIEDQT